MSAFLKSPCVYLHRRDSHFLNIYVFLKSPCVYLHWRDSHFLNSLITTFFFVIGNLSAIDCLFLSFQRPIHLYPHSTGFEIYFFLSTCVFVFLSTICSCLLALTWLLLFLFVDKNFFLCHWQSLCCYCLFLSFSTSHHISTYTQKTLKSISSSFDQSFLYLLWSKKMNFLI